MSGPEFPSRSRRSRRGAALTLVFAGVLAASAATSAWPRDDVKSPSSGRTRNVSDASPASSGSSATVSPQALEKAAADAEADGKSGTDAAEEVVSRSGDRWGAVYDRGEYEEFEQALDGRYTGVGLGARRARDGRIEVSAVQPGGPAALAGVRAGDLIRTIDGHRVTASPVTEVVSQLRGDDGGKGSSAAPGTAVTLGLQRGTHAWSRTVRRARLSTEAVTVRALADGATMIKVTAFTKGAGERVCDAVRTSDGGLLLDLRGNAGGLVTEATAAASAFLDGGLVATYDIHGKQRALYASGGGDTARPLVVLVDGGTMSAAELLTGALQDRGRAITVGTRTFGKGSVQMPSRLKDGSVAELTVGHYRTPAGHSVDGQGITPDLVATDRAEARAETVLSGLGGTS
ncbi:S41 family peptidase [Streptomyces beijiangensis]|uniref:PDZ domain-containing protein n=1 Tax=Streptomyces beijiangensis TaxID=163361 RepID=A0A939F8M5_9ACTN|nr:S41 family peptidase [Streptomyces beijiangensis]MBO0514405.1 PDZ domain-containing protein [Streptomyces beijiangensis]